METQPYRAMRTLSDSVLVLKTSPAHTLRQLHEVNSCRRNFFDLRAEGSCVYAKKIFSETPVILRVLWVFIPPALLWTEQTPLCFWVCFVALVPLAQLIGDFTDDLATALANDKLSGLLSATMGNLVEIIMSVALIRSRQFRVLQLSLVGSVLSNAALVFGTSVLCACAARFRENREAVLTFSVGDATMQGVGLLMMASVTWLYSTAHGPPDDTASLQAPTDSRIGCERATAVLLLLLYVADVCLQICGPSGASEDIEKAAADEKEENDRPSADLKAAARAGTALFATAVMTSLVSAHLTGSLENALSGSFFSRGFIGGILLPVVGNACEHTTAVRFAIQERAELVIGVSLGSAVQVATFAYPLAVLLAIPYGPLGFNCGLGAAQLLVVCAVLMLATTGDGKGTPQEGLALLGFYMIAVIFFAGQ